MFWLHLKTKEILETSKMINFSKRPIFKSKPQSVCFFNYKDKATFFKTKTYFNSFYIKKKIIENAELFLMKNIFLSVYYRFMCLYLKK